MRTLAAVLVMLVALAGPTEGGTSKARQASQPVTRSSGARIAALLIGAGAGFGLGLLAGLQWFDDAVNSDRKVWTTAAVFAGVGATAGWFIGQAVSKDAGAWPLAPRDTGALPPAVFQFSRATRMVVRGIAPPFQTLFSGQISPSLPSSGQTHR